MKRAALILTLIGCGAGLLVAQGARPLEADPPIVCDDCDGWNAPQPAFTVFGNTHYVGVAGLSAILVTSDAGHVLLDGGLPQSAPLIDRNIRALGYRTVDVRIILNSHAHFDHSGGIAALQRASGATVAASKAGAAALERGLPTPDDPQFAFGPKVQAFPAVAKVRVVGDGEVVRVGSIAVTARYTPGHTPGATTWTWQSCQGPRCVSVVYADSLNAISAPGFRFTGDGTSPSLVESFRRSVATVESLPCDILLTVHPAGSQMDDKLRQRAAQPDTNPFIDAGACGIYASGARTRLDARVAEERK